MEPLTLERRQPRTDCHVEMPAGPCAGRFHAALRERIARERLRQVVLVLTGELGIADRRLEQWHQQSPRLMSVAVCEFGLHSVPDELEQWCARGLRAVFVRARAGMRLQQQIEAYDAMLPAAMHIEFGCGWDELGRMAPLLARSRRVFVALAEGGTPAPLDAERLCWWGDMGNLYLKLVGAQRWEAHAAWVQPFPRDRLLWGGGAPAPADWCATLDQNATRLYGP